MRHFDFPEEEVSFSDLVFLALFRLAFVSPASAELNKKDLIYDKIKKKASVLSYLSSFPAPKTPPDPSLLPAFGFLEIIFRIKVSKASRTLVFFFAYRIEKQKRMSNTKTVRSKQA